MGFIVLVLGWLLFAWYNTLYGTITQPKQMVTINKGQTYYALVDDWDKKEKAVRRATRQTIYQNDGG